MSSERGGLADAFSSTAFGDDCHAESVAECDVERTISALSGSRVNGGLKLDTNDYGDGNTYSESGNRPRPLHAPLFLHGDTISGSFELSPAAPAANTLAWQTGVAVGGADESEYVPNPVVASRDSMAPAIRQRDGSMIRFK